MFARNTKIRPTAISSSGAARIALSCQEPCWTPYCQMLE